MKEYEVKPYAWNYGTGSGLCGLTKSKVIEALQYFDDSDVIEIGFVKNLCFMDDYKSYDGFYDCVIFYSKKTRVTIYCNAT